MISIKSKHTEDLALVERSGNVKDLPAGGTEKFDVDPESPIVAGWVAAQLVEVEGGDSKKASRQVSAPNPPVGPSGTEVEKKG